MKRPAVWIAAAAVLLCAGLAAAFIAGVPSRKEDPVKEGKTAVDKDVLDVLKTRFPEYFDLDTMKGLEVYVWQMAGNSFSWGLMSGTNRSKEDTELWNLKGTTTDEMRVILSSYGIPEENISVIPISKPYSSYYDPDIQTPGYAEKVRKMLFSDEPLELDLTEELFAVIMSSPQTSSNSWDYLNAHEAEHKKLLADKERTLRYIFGYFLASGQNMYWADGLPGVLMRIVLDELAPESMLDLAGTPSEYFKAWKDMALKQKTELGDEWLKTNAPAAYLLTQML
ncbi:MAG: hypothetical protein J5535_05990 [Firmicutes bacterium]|nr:hypothetical protein [Bacillota bacterium]